MFIGKFLLAAVFDLLSCLEKIMDDLLLSRIGDESSCPDSILNAYRLLLLELPLSELAYSEVDPTTCEPSAVAGLQEDEEALCAWRFSVSHSQVCLKNCSRYCLPHTQELIFENKLPFAFLSLPTEIPCWICMFNCLSPLLFETRDCDPRHVAYLVSRVSGTFNGSCLGSSLRNRRKEKAKSSW